jgi:type I restriction enzyme S subunit
MVSEWHEVPLRELVGYISKGVAPAYSEEETDTTIRVLNQKCNRNFQISYAESRLHETTKKKVPAERYVRENDILINSTGAGTAGRIAQIEKVPYDTTVDGHMIILRANDKVMQRYLGYALKAHQWEVLQLDEGSTGQTELNRERLLDEIIICFPESFDEQNKIVSILENIDRKLQINSILNDNLAA